MTLPPIPIARIADPEDPRVAAFRDIRERDLVGRQGRFVAEGTVVLRMLARAHAAQRGISADSILVLENRLVGIADILAAFPPDVPVLVASQGVFDAIAGFHMHRGVLAIGRRTAVPTASELMDGLPDSSLVLALCGLSNHDNMGALFRNAAAFGVDAVMIDETSCDPLYRKAIRVSVGSVLTLPFARCGPADDMVSALDQAGFAVWGLSPAGQCSIADVPESPRIALLLGTEGEGLPQDLLARLQTARIPQRPSLDSLNVATAGAIALYEVAKRSGRV